MLPRMLMRVPYENDGSTRRRLPLRRRCQRTRDRKYLWGTPAYAFGSVLMRAFATSGWFADIRGVDRGVKAAAWSPACPSTPSAPTLRRGPQIVDRTYRCRRNASELSDAGFIPLCHCQDTSNLGLLRQPVGAKAEAIRRPRQQRTNARISAMLQYVLCVSRFAHYLKVICPRQAAAPIATKPRSKASLTRWLSDYTTVDDRPVPQPRPGTRSARAGSRSARSPASPAVTVVMHLLPHFQLDQLTASRENGHTSCRHLSES